MITKLNTHINYPVMVRTQGYEYTIILFMSECDGLVLQSSNKTIQPFSKVNQSIHDNSYQFLDVGERITFIQPKHYKTEKR